MSMICSRPTGLNSWTSALILGIKPLMKLHSKTSSEMFCKGDANISNCRRYSLTVVVCRSAENWAHREPSYVSRKRCSIWTFSSSQFFMGRRSSSHWNHASASPSKHTAMASHFSSSIIRFTLKYRSTLNVHPSGLLPSNTSMSNRRMRDSGLHPLSNPLPLFWLPSELVCASLKFEGEFGSCRLVTPFSFSLLFLSLPWSEHQLKFSFQVGLKLLEFSS